MMWEGTVDTTMVGMMDVRDEHKIIENFINWVREMGYEICELDWDNDDGSYFSPIDRVDSKDLIDRYLRGGR